jgi:hypothetical protein
MCDKMQGVALFLATQMELDSRYRLKPHLGIHKRRSDRHTKHAKHIGYRVEYAQRLSSVRL